MPRSSRKNIVVKGNTIKKKKTYNGSNGSPSMRTMVEEHFGTSVLRIPTLGSVGFGCAFIQLKIAYLGS